MKKLFLDKIFRVQFPQTKGAELERHQNLVSALLFYG